MKAKVIIQLATGDYVTGLETDVTDIDYREMSTHFGEILSDEHGYLQLTTVNDKGCRTEVFIGTRNIVALMLELKT